jgi:hypothetical protein
MATHMKRNRLIFYSVIGVLHLFLFLFSLYMDSQRNNIQFLFNLQGGIGLLKYCTAVLLILFATNIILHLRDNKRHTRENAQLIQELNMLKAKLYDIQETSKETSKKTSEPNPPRPA